MAKKNNSTSVHKREKVNTYIVNQVKRYYTTLYDNKMHLNEYQKEEQKTKILDMALYSIMQVLLWETNPITRNRLGNPKHQY